MPSGPADDFGLFMTIFFKRLLSNWLFWEIACIGAPKSGRRESREDCTEGLGSEKIGVQYVLRREDFQS